MQERYLFKAKRKDNGEWIQGNLITDETDDLKCFIGYIMGTDEDGIPHDIDVVLVDPDTICQCTGLKDKNGNLIWENDIVSYCDCTKEDYVISWEQNKACFEYQQYSCSMMNFDELSSCEVEVVGNVFDNPELLEM